MYSYILDHLEDLPFAIGVIGVPCWGRIFIGFYVFAGCLAYELHFGVEQSFAVVEFEECACCVDHFALLEGLWVGGVDGNNGFHHLPPSTAVSASLFVLKLVTFLSSVFEDFPLFRVLNSCTHAMALWASSCSCGA